MREIIRVPAIPGMLPSVQAAVRSVLQKSARVEDAEAIITEFARNVLLHRDACCSVGEIRVFSGRAHRTERLRLANTVPAKHAVYQDGDEEDYVRGLKVIRTLCNRELGDRWGQDRYPDHEEWWVQLCERQQPHD
jgi:hypothetical protein